MGLSVKTSEGWKEDSKEMKQTQWDHPNNALSVNIFIFTLQLQVALQKYLML